MATGQIRIPAPPQEAEQRQVAKVYKLLLKTKTACLVGPNNSKLELPPSVYKILVQILQNIQEGKRIAIVPFTEELSTQAAANILGISRQFLVKELEAGKISFHRAGSHRRICLKDVLEYKNQRQIARAESIGRMARMSEEAGVYDRFIPSGK